MANFTTTGSDTFAAGMMLKQSTNIDHTVSPNINTTSESYTDTGIELTHVTAAASTDSYIALDFYSGMVYQDTAARAGRLCCTMRTVSNSTYAPGEEFTTRSYLIYNYMAGGAYYIPMALKFYCGTPGEMGMPDTKSSWAAGDTLYFRMFYKRDSSSTGNWTLCHVNTTWSLSAREIAI